ncbi:MAG: hypothetical protein LBJ14_08110, partial [Desulfarculales bacterium]|nr:hypothetical protein [Desulfarculales bacterium]
MRNADKKNLTVILDRIRQAARYLRSKPKGAERRQKYDALSRGLTALQQEPALGRLVCDEYPAMNALDDWLAGEQWDEFARFGVYAQTKLRQEAVQYKVVFFPYLASTWDSLQSVYEAFAKDERFITDIVIIPAHRRAPTGRVSLYEDFLADTDIPHTLYQDYDLAQDQPDIAFVNNPFDQVVEPSFYAANIRRHCKTLVYVPYYGILSGYFSEKRLKVYNQPIQLLADLIIVQSQITAQAYNRHCPGPQGRYLPLGTPKIDACKKKTALAAQNPKREWVEKIAGRPVFLLDSHYDIPSEWRGRLDGGIFYCLLFFLEAILNYFSGRPDLFLIWRPHPLTETALINYTTNPSLYSAFTKLMKLCNSLPNCLIDREDDFHMSFSLSAAMIALSQGSLKYVYLSLGKPVIYFINENEALDGTQRLIPTNDICYVPPHLK